MLFSVSSVDNFFEEPDKIVKLSNQFEYKSDGTVYGIRTEPLHNDFMIWLNKKILATLFPQQYNDINFLAKTMFQKTKPSNLDGWVHIDRPNLLTAIIYLNKEDTSGTSFYKSKEPMFNLNQDLKFKYFNNEINNELKVLEAKEKNNDQFKKTITIDGVYNRLITFDGSTPHAAEVINNNEERLILISFFEEINGNFLRFPIPQSKGL